MTRKYKAGTYEIFRLLYRSDREFTDFIEAGIPRRTASIRLKELEDSGYLHRDVLMTRPSGTRYIIDEKGRKKFKEMVLQIIPQYLEDLLLVAPHGIT